jgi:16S rRNA processing protein RimM
LANLPPDLIEVGRVADAYGIKGWLKVVPFASAEESALKRTKRWWLTGSSLALSQDEREVHSSRVHADVIVAQLVGVSDRDVALKFKGATISVRRTDFLPNQVNEFYWVDLQGCTVTNAEDVCLGDVLEVFDNGAQSVLRISLSSAAALLLGDAKVDEVLIPFVDQYILHADTDKKVIRVDWPLSWLTDE